MLELGLVCTVGVGVGVKVCPLGLGVRFSVRV